MAIIKPVNLDNPSTELLRVRDGSYGTLMSILSATGGQCRDLSTGLIWSYFLVLLRIIIAALN